MQAGILAKGQAATTDRTLRKSKRPLSLADLLEHASKIVERFCEWNCESIIPSLEAGDKPEPQCIQFSNCIPIKITTQKWLGDYSNIERDSKTTKNLMA